VAVSTQLLLFATARGLLTGHRCPSALASAAYGPGADIPGDAALIFELELLLVRPVSETALLECLTPHMLRCLFYRVCFTMSVFVTFCRVFVRVGLFVRVWGWACVVVGLGVGVCEGEEGSLLRFFIEIAPRC
jgi:hypothetical protein